MQRNKFYKSRNFIFIFALIVGFTLAIGASVWATSIGTNVSVTGDLSNSGAFTSAGAATFNGNSTFGNEAADVNLFTGGLQASSTALFGGAVTFYGNSTFGNEAADVNLFTGGLQASSTALFGGATIFYGSNTFGDAAGDVNLFTGTLRASSTALITGTTTLYAALTLGSLSADPTGATGMIYYNSTGGGSVRLYNGSSWGVIGTSTGLALNGSSIRLSDITTGFFTLGTTTPRGASLLTVEATSTAAIPLTLVARNLQAANLFQVADSGGTNLFTLSAAGNPTSTQLTTTGQTYLATAGGSVGVGTTSPGTLFSVHGAGYISNNLFVGGNITSTSSVASTLPYASTTAVSISSLTSGRVPYITTGGLLADDADFTFDGTSKLTATYASSTAISVSGSASTTALVVGSGTSLSGVMAGMCTTAGTATISATSSGYVVCTPVTSGLIRGTGDTVLVMATSSLPANFIVQSASSTAANTISVEVVNLGSVGAAGGTVVNGTSIVPTAFNFWAFR